MRRFVLVFVLISSSALAHDVYPRDCCDGQDCMSVTCAEIQQIGPQTWQHGRSTFNANAVRQPIDDRCHVCKAEPFGHCIMFPKPGVS